MSYAGHPRSARGQAYRHCVLLEAWSRQNAECRWLYHSPLAINSGPVNPGDVIKATCARRICGEPVQVCEDVIGHGSAVHLWAEPDTDVLRAESLEVQAALWSRAVKPIAGVRPA